MRTEDAVVNVAPEPLRDGPALDLWQPRWTVDVGHGCEVGVTTDDGCFLVLYPTKAGRWRPGAHIPTAAARLMGALCDEA